MLMARLGALILAPMFLANGVLAGDMLIADFEQDTYGDWKTTGEAFGKGPAHGTLPGQMPVSGFLGRGLVNSYRNGDAAKGTLTSPPIKLEKPFLNFLIGGGGHAGTTCINLLVDGKIMRTAAGPNTQPGGSEELDWHSWDVKDFVGKPVVLQIVDDHSGGWGHINIDQIVQSDAGKKAGPATRDIVIDKRYLHLPVKTGAAQRRMKFIVDGRVVREFDIEISDEPGLTAFADVSAFQSRTLRVEVNKLPVGSNALARIVTDDKVPGAASLYREKHRPQFHFTSRFGWLNDPNGLVYFDGEYHLYYQHNPFGWNWGNMHWGHAVSRDLVHWEELPIALYPPRHGDWMFSGSAFVVKAGQAGFDRDTLAAAFTSTGRGECLAFSHDRGRTWKEPDGNPVVKHAGRDPKVIWHEPTRRWVMAVYDEHNRKQWIAFYSSSDLKKWELESRIEGFFECPDIFELPVDGEPGTTKWVLYAADGKYVLGQFDGKRFTPESGKHHLWHGNFYAAQTFSNNPDGRRLQIGWGQNITFPGMPFNQQMTVACQLSLRRTSAGIRMFAEPVKELQSLRGRNRRWVLDRNPGEVVLTDSSSDSMEIRVRVRPGNGNTTLNVRDVPIVYDIRKGELVCRGVRAPMPLDDGELSMQILADRGSLEVFAGGGRVAMSVGTLFDPKNRTVKFTAHGATATVEIHELKSIWGN